MKSELSLLVLALFAATLAHASAMGTSDSPLKIPKFDPESVNVEIDGRLNESVWRRVPSHGELVVIDPDTLADTPFETRIHVFYTSEGMYVGVWNEQDVTTLISRLSSRDQFIPRDDVSLTLDPGGDGLYGYWFGVNLGGTLQDGTVLPERQFSNEWDGPWDGASAEHDQGWSAELFLPWSMMSMPEQGGDKRTMGMYLSREVAYKDERWAWPALPATRGVFLSKLQKIRLENITPKRQFTFYPFASTTYDNIISETHYQAGFDFFWRPSSNLQFTATVNPDFGNVESDDVVVNLSSVETFFPEKRPFFLEGNEIFVTTPRARRGRGTPTTLVNTRRIGGPPIFPDLPGLTLTDLEKNQPSALHGAVKVTGQRGKFRYGALAAIEDDTKLEGRIQDRPVEILQDGRDFGISRFLYEDTTTGARRALGWITTMVDHPAREAVVHGMDAHYLSADGALTADGQLVYSDVNDVTGGAGWVDLTYRPSKGIRHELSVEYFDDEVEFNDFGFLRRNDAIGVDYAWEVTESDLPDLKSRTIRIMLSQQYNMAEGRVVRSGLFTTQQRQFNDNSFLDIDLNFYPARWDDLNSDGNGSFRVVDRGRAGVTWGSDRSKPLSVRTGAQLNREDLGSYSREYTLQFMWRPTDRFSLVTKLNYKDRDGWLIHTGGRTFTTYDAENWRPSVEMDFFLSAKQQFRIIAQWAGIKAREQDRWLVPVGDGDLLPVTAEPGASSRDFTISRLTFQARYRWELAPLSDLFVVYTRGSDVDSMPEATFNTLLQDSWTRPLVDRLVVKLRYRLGG